MAALNLFKDGAIMSKSIKIPEDRGSRIEVKVNGRTYVYSAGQTVTVTDEVAEVLENMLALDPHGTRESAGGAFLSDIEKQIKDVAGDVDALDDRLTALDDTTDGAVPALNTRLTAIDTPSAGALAALEARVKALEGEDSTAAGTGD